MRNDETKVALKRYLTEVRNYPLPLAEHLAAYGFKLLPDAVTVRHWIEERFEILGLRALPSTALLIPYYQETVEMPVVDERTGSPYFRLRCDPPAVGRDGKALRYLAPSGSKNHLCVPPGMPEMAIRDRFLVITEGELKAWVASYYNVPTIAVSGVWNWRGGSNRRRRIDHADGGHEFAKAPGQPIADLERFPWHELVKAQCRVYIAFDSDAAISGAKGGVDHARHALAKHLREAHGLDVHLVDLPSGPKGEKQGLDDLILAEGAERFTDLLAQADITALAQHAPNIRDLFEAIAGTSSPLAVSALLALYFRSLVAMPPSVARDEWEARIRHQLKLSHRQVKAYYRAAVTEHSKDDWAATRGRELEVARAEYGLDLEETPYRISAGGVAIYKSTAPKPGETAHLIARRPIWPTAAGTDIATGDHLIKVTWDTVKGTRESRWCPASVLTSREELAKLGSAPLSAGRLQKVADWLSDALSCITPESRERRVTSRLGWVVDGAKRQFILADAPGVEYIGSSISQRGDLAAWADGMAMLVEMGVEGFPGLACLGLSAAAPLVRHLGKRNPVLGLTWSSGTGKGCVIGYALSIWGAPQDFTVDTNQSSLKGIQNRGHELNDLPFFLDELHQLFKREPRDVENALYYLGNGLQRTVATKDGNVLGGSRRWGVGFVAAEQSLPDLQKGAQWRVIEIEMQPLRTGDQADKLTRLARENPGAAARALIPLLEDQAHVSLDGLEARAKALRQAFPGLDGDDPFTIALAEAGLQLLAAATGVPASPDVGAWLAGITSAKRRAKHDSIQRSFEVLLTTVLNATWKPVEGRSGMEVAVVMSDN